MSGIYILGMDMPKSCFHCRFTLDGACILMNRKNKETTNSCPIIFVPDHGRLIDADALDADLEKQDMKTGEWDVIGFSIFEIDNAPTIIPTDKEE